MRVRDSLGHYTLRTKCQFSPNLYPGTGYCTTGKPPILTYRECRSKLRTFDAVAKVNREDWTPEKKEDPGPPSDYDGAGVDEDIVFVDLHAFAKLIPMDYLPFQPYVRIQLQGFTEVATMLMLYKGLLQWYLCHLMYADLLFMSRHWFNEMHGNVRRALKFPKNFQETSCIPAPPLTSSIW